MFRGVLPIGSSGKLSQITMVVPFPGNNQQYNFLLYSNTKLKNTPLHFIVENFGLSSTGVCDEMVVQNTQDIRTDVFQLLLNLEQWGKYILRLIVEGLVRMKRQEH